MNISYNLSKFNFLLLQEKKYLAFLFWMKALQLTKSTDKISNLIFIFPFISLIFIHYFLGEVIHLTTLYGLLLVVAGIFLQKTNLRKRKNVS